jgi:hypothetical protein
LRQKWLELRRKGLELMRGLEMGQTMHANMVRALGPKNKGNAEEEGNWNSPF